MTILFTPLPHSIRIQRTKTHACALTPAPLPSPPSATLAIIIIQTGNLRERVALAVAGVSTKAIDRLTAALDPRALAQLSKRPTGAASNAATASASGSSSSSVTNPGAGDSSSEGAEASATRALRRRCREHAEDIAAVLFESAIQVNLGTMMPLFILYNKGVMIQRPTSQLFLFSRPSRVGVELAAGACEKDRPYLARPFSRRGHERCYG